MDNNKNDAYFLGKVEQDLLFIVKNMSGVELEELNNNEILLDSMLFRMIQISENSKKLSDDFKSDNPSIPWTAMYGLRNRIVHDYGNVDLNIVFQTLKNDVPELLEMIDSALTVDATNVRHSQTVTINETNRHSRAF